MVSSDGFPGDGSAKVTYVITGDGTKFKEIDGVTCGTVLWSHPPKHASLKAVRHWQPEDAEGVASIYASLSL